MPSDSVKSPDWEATKTKHHKQHRFKHNNSKTSHSFSSPPLSALTHQHRLSSSTHQNHQPSLDHHLQEYPAYPKSHSPNRIAARHRKRDAPSPSSSSPSIVPDESNISYHSPSPPWVNTSNSVDDVNREGKLPIESYLTPSSGDDGIPKRNKSPQVRRKKPRAKLRSKIHPHHHIQSNRSPNPSRRYYRQASPLYNHHSNHQHQPSLIHINKKKAFKVNEESDNDDSSYVLTSDEASSYSNLPPSNQSSPPSPLPPNSLVSHHNRRTASTYRIDDTRGAVRRRRDERAAVADERRSILKGMEVRRKEATLRRGGKRRFGGQVEESRSRLLEREGEWRHHHLSNDRELKYDRSVITLDRFDEGYDDNDSLDSSPGLVSSSDGADDEGRERKREGRDKEGHRKRETMGEVFVSEDFPVVREGIGADQVRYNSRNSIRGIHPQKSRYSRGRHGQDKGRDLQRSPSPHKEDRGIYKKRHEGQWKRDKHPDAHRCHVDENYGNSTFVKGHDAYMEYLNNRLISSKKTIHVSPSPSISPRRSHKSTSHQRTSTSKSHITKQGNDRFTTREERRTRKEWDEQKSLEETLRYMKDQEFDIHERTQFLKESIPALVSYSDNTLKVIREQLCELFVGTKETMHTLERIASFNDDNKYKNGSSFGGISGRQDEMSASSRLTDKGVRSNVAGFSNGGDDLKRILPHISAGWKQMSTNLRQLSDVVSVLSSRKDGLKEHFNRVEIDIEFIRRKNDMQRKLWGEPVLLEAIGGGRSNNERNNKDGEQEGAVNNCVDDNVTIHRSPNFEGEFVNKRDNDGDSVRRRWSGSQ